MDPDSPVPKAGRSSTAAEPAARLTAVIQKPRAPVDKRYATPQYNRSQDLDSDLPAGAMLAGCGSCLRLEWRANESDRWRSADWILLPYVHPVESEVRANFRKAIVSKLNLDTSDVNAFNASLLCELRTNRKALVSLYTDHFEVGQNAISMSLYSGPQWRKQTKSADNTGWLRPVGRSQIGYEMRSSPVAWLGTGDSKLKNTARRKPWLEFFRRFSEEISVLSLPHHGSCKDFDEEILEFAGLSLAVATTIRDRNRIANLEETLGRVAAMGKEWKIVDDKAENNLTIACARVLKPA